MKTEKTEEEIIKAFEVCTNDSLNCDNGCPYNNRIFRCRISMALDALNLIRKQQAEIEKLKIENQSLQSSADERICTMKKIDNRTKKWW